MQSLICRGVKGLINVHPCTANIFHGDISFFQILNLRFFSFDLKIFLCSVLFQRGAFIFQFIPFLGDTVQLSLSLSISLASLFAPASPQPVLMKRRSLAELDAAKATRLPSSAAGRWESWGGGEKSRPTSAPVASASLVLVAAVGGGSGGSGGLWERSRGGEKLIAERRCEAAGM